MLCGGSNEGERHAHVPVARDKRAMGTDPRTAAATTLRVVYEAVG